MQDNMIEKIEGKLGPIIVYHDIICVPMEHLLDGTNNIKFKGGPIYPDWDEKPLSRHYTRKSNPIDTKPEMKEPEEVIDEPIAWGGAIHRHYGHTIADICIPRVISVLAEMPDTTFLFGIHPNLNQIPSWLNEVFEYLGVKKFILLKKPCLVKKLFVGPQVEYLSSGIYDEMFINPYLEWLNSLVDTKIKPLNGEVSKDIFVSRAELTINKGKIVGEKYLCSLFEKNRFKVIYPEKLPIKDQLRIYYNADRLIFTEGSALHTLQLLGKIKAEVYVINRRKANKLAYNQFKIRTAKVIYLDCLYNEFRQAGRPMIPGILNIKTLLNKLNEFEINLKHFSLKDWNLYFLEDCLAILNFYCNSNLSMKNEIINTLQEDLTKIGLKNLFYIVFPEKSLEDLSQEVYFYPYYEDNINYLSSLNKFLKEGGQLIFHEAYKSEPKQMFSILKLSKNHQLESLESHVRKTILDNLPSDVSQLGEIAHISEIEKEYLLAEECYRIMSEIQPTKIGAKITHALFAKACGKDEYSKGIFREIINSQLDRKILNRTTIIQHLINRFHYKTYLEIGVARGLNFFQIKAPLKIGVDPNFTIPGGFKNSESEIFYSLTSDEFFRNPPNELIKSGIDIALIDGLHNYEQSLRDVENSLKYLNPNGVIIMHDCLPTNPAEAMPSFQEAKKHPEFKNAWTGDVYKAILHLRVTYPELFVAVLNVDWGVGIIKRGKPENMLDLSIEQIKALTFEEFSKEKEKLLNLKPVNWFWEFFIKL